MEVMLSVIAHGVDEQRQPVLVSYTVGNAHPSKLISIVPPVQCADQILSVTLVTIFPAGTGSPKVSLPQADVAPQLPEGSLKHQ
jgi:hypothetical protein